MKEQLISFETAKLAREKKFDIEVQTTYYCGETKYPYVLEENLAVELKIIKYVP